MGGLSLTVVSVQLNNEAVSQPTGWPVSGVEQNTARIRIDRVASSPRVTAAGQDSIDRWSGAGALLTTAAPHHRPTVGQSDQRSGRLEREQFHYSNSSSGQKARNCCHRIALNTSIDGASLSTANTAQCSFADEYMTLLTARKLRLLTTECRLKIEYSVGWKMT